MFNKKLYKICSILFIFIMFLGVFSVYANNVPKDPSEGYTGTGVDAVTGKIGKIWATIERVVQVLAVAAVVFAGLRYMFASADGKADIKRETVILIIGAVFVFGAVKIASLVSGVASDLL